MNKNTKFIIGASIALVVIFGTVLGATYGITKALAPDEDKVVFHIANKEYNLEDVQQETTKALRESTDNELSAEEQSNILLSQFYSLALFGTSDYSSLQGNKIENYIFKGGNDWNVPKLYESIGDEVKFKEDFVRMKLLKETTNTSISDYITPLAQNNLELKNILKEMATNGLLGLNYFELLDAAGEDNFNRLISALSDDPSYQKDVLEEIMIYSYLWQDSRKSMYDYNITESLVNSKASMVNQINFDYDASSSNVSDLLDKNNDDKAVTKADFDTVISNIGEENMTDNVYQNTLGDEYMSGFTGIQFDTTADNGDVLKDDFTDITNTWNIEDGNEIGGEATTIAGSNSSEDVLKSGNYYIAKKGENSNGSGAILANEKANGLIQGDAKIISYSQLAPYIFGQKRETFDGDTYISNIKYSMFANKDGDNFTYADSNSYDEYIFDRWFPNNAEMGEIYVAESLAQHDSSLKSSAFEYWYDKGYYIELSGASSDKYLSFIPTDLLIKE